MAARRRIMIAAGVALCGALLLGGAPREGVSRATGDPPAPTATADPAPVAPTAPAAAAGSATCPRCGYRCDAGWRHCASCGWDLRTLVGDAAERQLTLLTRATVGVIVVKRKRGLQDIISERDYKRISRYLSGVASQRKAWATAFPFGAPGLFVTSARMVDQAEEIRIRTATNHEYPAELVGIDEASGVALIRSEVPGVEPLTAASDGPVQGEAVFAVCYPVALDDELVRYLPVSLHRGRMSDLGQSGSFLAAIENLVRADHTLPQGCLGGPLIDPRGTLAGMILGSPDRGITYGVPAGDVAAVASALAAGAPPPRAYFGMGLVAADPRRRTRFGIEGVASHPLVAYLIPGSPAAGAGVQPGDLLAAVGGEAVTTVSEAGARLLRATPAGPPVTLTLIRAGQEVGIVVSPVIRPERVLLDPVDEFQEALEANLVAIDTGPTAQQGLKIEALVRGGRGERDDFKDGDLISSVDGKGVRRLETFSSIVRSGNTHVFREGGGEERGSGDGKKEPPREYNTYFIRLDVRAADGAREHRSYFNLFPEALAPPVY